MNSGFSLLKYIRIQYQASLASIPNQAKYTEAKFQILQIIEKQ